MESIDIARIGMAFIPFLFALSVHEYAHGLVAGFLGDNTAKSMGRLTLNPVAHMDMIGTLILPLLALSTGGGMFFGWAKPVPVNDLNFKNSKTGMAIVAAAGPLSNIIMATAGALVVGFTAKFFPAATYSKAVVDFSIYFMKINLVLALFNLIPLHPLDGGKIFTIFFPRSVNDFLEKYQMPINIALVVFFISGLGGIILGPIIPVTQFLLNTSLSLFGANA